MITIISLLIWVAFSASAWFAIAKWWSGLMDFTLKDGLVFAFLCLLPPFSIAGNLFWLAVLCVKIEYLFPKLNLNKVLFPRKYK